MGAHSKTPVIRRRRARKEKIAKLRKKYGKAASADERNKIIEKLKKLSPFMTIEEFLKPASAPDSGKEQRTH